MVVTYAQHISTRRTPQSEPIPLSNQVANSAGGYSYPVDDWTRLDRFLILGCEGGSYYAGERQLTQENAQAVVRCFHEDGLRAVHRIAHVSDMGRAPKNEPAIFALALAASFMPSPAPRLPSPPIIKPSDDTGVRATKLRATAEYRERQSDLTRAWNAQDSITYRVVRRAALDALPLVCRTPTDLFQFNQYLEQFRGRGKLVNEAMKQWYLAKTPRELAYLCSKYQQRDGWSHRDLLRLIRPKASGTTAEVFHWATKGWPCVGEDPHPNEALQPIWALEKAKVSTTDEVVQLIKRHSLVRECVPTQHLKEPAVWEALLEKMPPNALVRNLATMTRIGLLTTASDATSTVVKKLTDEAALKKARVHPLKLLVALLVYRAGRSPKGDSTWTPVPRVLDALDEGFYKAFANVTPTGKKWCIGLDVSGSMHGTFVRGTDFLPAHMAQAACALVTLASEKLVDVFAFDTQLYQSTMSARERLDDVVKNLERVGGGGTDCALPILWAQKTQTPVDVFAIFTDSETWQGSIHPSQAIMGYRQRLGIGAKLAVVSMCANKVSIADPADAYQMDAAGFDANLPQILSDFARGDDVA